MVLKPIFNLEKGITLIEIVVVIFITILFSMMVISDFPKIQKQHALSAVTYKLAQDLRRVEDMGLSGVIMKDKNEEPIKAQGYGLYITSSSSLYFIYADVDGNKKYSPGQYCDFSGRNPNDDCIIEATDVSKQSSSISITGFIPSASQVSINFNPPGPTTTITTDGMSRPSIEINIGNGSTTRKIQVNNSGLINVQ
jgi:hypothetical protein